MPFSIVLLIGLLLAPLYTVAEASVLAEDEVFSVSYPLSQGEIFSTLKLSTQDMLYLSIAGVDHVETASITVSGGREGDYLVPLINEVKSLFHHHSPAFSGYIVVKKSSQVYLLETRTRDLGLERTFKAQLVPLRNASGHFLYLPYVSLNHADKGRTALFNKPGDMIALERAIEVFQGSKNCKSQLLP